MVPKYPQDVFYKGSLWKAGFLLGKGQSASCPDIFVRSKRKNKTVREKLKGFGLALKYMMDFTIFRSPVFMCFCFHSMLLYVSYDIPYMYLPDLAKDLSISTTRASFLLSISGIASTVGQVKHLYHSLWISSSTIIILICSSCSNSVFKLTQAYVDNSKCHIQYVAVKCRMWSHFTFIATLLWQQQSHYIIDLYVHI